MAVAVAPEAVVDEDDWEWIIALARARVAAEAAETAAPALPTPATAPEAIDSGPPRSVTRPMETVAMKEPASSGWPTTESIAAIDDSRIATRPAVAIPLAGPAASPMPGGAPAAFAMPRASAPVTVIPVPALPSIHGAGHAGRFEPVVRTIATQVPPASLNRFPKGTAPISPNTPSPSASPLSDDTEPSLSIGDRTTPGFALPLAARAVALPSTRRRTITRG
jgi:hypothetical protein